MNVISHQKLLAMKYGFWPKGKSFKARSSKVYAKKAFQNFGITNFKANETDDGKDSQKQIKRLILKHPKD